MLNIQGLSIAFKMENTFVPVTQDISFHLEPGETLGIVGESGSGKSVTSMALMGLLPKRNSRITNALDLILCKRMLYQLS